MYIYLAIGKGAFSSFLGFLPTNLIPIMATGEHDPFSTGYKTDRLPKGIHDTAVKATMTLQYSTTPVNSAADWNAHARREVTA